MKAAVATAFGEIDEKVFLMEDFETPTLPEGDDANNRKCCNCGKPGHMAKDCRGTKKGPQGGGGAQAVQGGQGNKCGGCGGGGGGKGGNVETRTCFNAIWTSCNKDASRWKKLARITTVFEPLDWTKAVLARRYPSGGL